jgi:hypothetical protein
MITQPTVQSMLVGGLNAAGHSHISNPVPDPFPRLFPL